MYLSNRKNFIAFINEKLAPYKEIIRRERENQRNSCDAPKPEEKDAASHQFALLMHQEVGQHYINAVTPYRGVLLYHGLGSGKSCSSIAIAEGLKHTRQVTVFTPASLRTNYIQVL